MWRVRLGVIRIVAGSVGAETDEFFASDRDWVDADHLRADGCDRVAVQVLTYESAGVEQELQRAWRPDVHRNGGEQPAGVLG